MDKNVPIVQQRTIRFKTYPTNEQFAHTYTQIIMLNAKGPRIVHEMGLSYETIFCDRNSIQPKLYNFHRPLEKLKLINSLTVSLPDAHIENNLLLKNFSLRMKSLSSLQILNLDLPYISWISLKGIRYLASALAQMKLLKKLIMIFNHTDGVNDECLEALFLSSKKYKNLQSLELDVSHCEDITEKSFKSLALTLKHLQQSLKVLALGLGGLKLTDGNALDLLASGLTNLKDLQTLQISFSDIEISSVNNFCSFLCSLKHLQSLKALSLGFRFLPIDASILKDLASSVKSQKFLHTLSLDFGNCLTIGIQEMKILAQCLQLTASSLKNVTLDFSCSNTMNDKALENLSIGLKALINLSEINLQCFHCPNVGEVGIESVTRELGGLPNLQSVTLGFSYCHPIKDTHYNALKMKKNIKKLIFDYVHSST